VKKITLLHSETVSKKERQKERKNRDIREGGERERESYIIVIVILYF
jgi:hypothetical protein